MSKVESERLILQGKPTLADKDTVVAQSGDTKEGTAEGIETFEDLVAGVLEYTPEEKARKLMEERTQNAQQFYNLLSLLLPYEKSFQEGTTLSTECLVPILAMCTLAANKVEDVEIKKILFGHITKTTIGGKTVNFKDVVKQLLTSAKKAISEDEANAELIETVEKVQQFFANPS